MGGNVMKIKKLLYRMKRSIWIYPVMYTVFAVFLAVAVIIIDARIFFNLSPYIPSLFTTSTDLAKTVLTIIASAFITIMTFTFSTTMLVLTLYSSQFSPRVVENFLTQKSTMKTFGIFVSGFMYAIISLLFIRDVLSEYKILAGTFGVLYIVVGLINFILYINNVGKYIQASNIIDRLYDKARKDLAGYKKEVEEYDAYDREAIEGIETKIRIKSLFNGYIQEVDYNRLFMIAKKNKIILIFDKLPGQFITDEDTVAKIYYDRNSTLDENLREEISEAMNVGKRRTEVQDFSFSIQKLVEVALKALSPGINDPNTAIACIRDLGLLLRDLSSLKVGYILVRDEENQNLSALYRESYDLDKILSDTFNQIIHYGQGDIFVMLSVIKAHRHILENADERTRAVVLDHLYYLRNILMKKPYEMLDRKMLDQELEEISGRYGEEWNATLEKSKQQEVKEENMMI